MFLIFVQASCVSSESYAPVVNAWQDPAAMKSKYRVQKDDTIYSIALAFDMDYRDLAKANHLSSPYRLKLGQMLTMHIANEIENKIPSDGVPTTFSIKEISQNNHNFQEINSIPDADIQLPEINLKLVKPLQEKTIDLNRGKIISKVDLPHWQWPAQGTIIKEFSLQTGGSKGIDIAGTLGESVRATAPGKVVYSGCGLRGYGNLIIIKHSDNYLSAYAYNQKLLVQEGDVVKTGAEIAKMGQNSNGQVLLHFEIRRNGKPVNPLLYL